MNPPNEQGELSRFPWKARAEHNFRVAEQYRRYFEDATEQKMKVVLTCEQLVEMTKLGEAIVQNATDVHRKVSDAIIMIEEGRPHLALPILQQVLTLIGKP